MKRIAVLLLAAWILLAFAAGADAVKMYSMDGREITVDGSEVESYKTVGWYENIEEVTTWIFALDGRCARIYKADLWDYLSLGWFEKYEDVVVTVYAPDGRCANIYKADLPAYKAQGWYDRYEDVITTVFSNDGRQAVIYKGQLPAYKAQGWQEKYEDVIMTIYATGGRSATIYKADWAKYKKQGWYDRPLNADPSKPMVALTFDDGPSLYTQSILNTLSANGGRATFFVVGECALTYPSVLQCEEALKMEIGNHSYSHPKLDGMSYNNIRIQLNAADNAVYKAVGHFTHLLRPPNGAKNTNVCAAAGKPIILWSLDTHDWETQNADMICAAVLNNVKDGDIILMHDDYEATAAAVARIVPELRNRGFQLVTVSELASYRGKTLESGVVYTAFRK
ncbi:MAG: polysaccharide deacetylase family protein [Clostridia bacterium]|nr:polysaccharide deacetylase family protein [Clostridia bacterium]